MVKQPGYAELEQRINELEAVVNSPANKDFKRLFKLSHDILCVADIDGRFRSINQSFEESLGYTKEELLEHPFLYFVHPEDQAATVDFEKQLTAGKPVVNFTNRYRCKDGSYKYLSWTSMPVPDEGLTVAVARNITERKQVEKALLKAHKVLEMRVKERTAELTEANEALHAEIAERKLVERELQGEQRLSEEYINSLPGLFYVFDEQRFVRWNKEWNRVTGYSDEELGSRFGTDFFEGDDKLLIGEQMLRVFSEGVADAEAKLVTKDGQQIPYYFTGIRKEIDGIGHLIGLGIDITTRKRMEYKLEYLATHDCLTGLYNRNALEQWLNDEICRATRYNHALSVLMVDIDHFKAINDAYGHQAGDTAIRSFAGRLESSIRETDYAARYGGEEFVIILPETPLAKAEELAERLRNRIAGHSISIEDDKELSITISVGIATFPQHTQSWEYLLETADKAMYAAKKAGRNQVKTPA